MTLNMLPRVLFLFLSFSVFLLPVALNEVGGFVGCSVDGGRDATIFLGRVYQQTPGRTATSPWVFAHVHSEVEGGTSFRTQQTPVPVFSIKV